MYFEHQIEPRSMSTIIEVNMQGFVLINHRYLYQKPPQTWIYEGENVAPIFESETSLYTLGDQHLLSHDHWIRLSDLERVPGKLIDYDPEFLEFRNGVIYSPKRAVSEYIDLEPVDPRFTFHEVTKHGIYSVRQNDSIYDRHGDKLINATIVYRLQSASEDIFAVQEQVSKLYYRTKMIQACPLHQYLPYHPNRICYRDTASTIINLILRKFGAHDQFTESAPFELLWDYALDNTHLCTRSGTPLYRWLEEARNKNVA